MKLLLEESDIKTKIIELNTIDKEIIHLLSISKSSFKHTERLMKCYTMRSEIKGLGGPKFLLEEIDKDIEKLENLVDTSYLDRLVKLNLSSRELSNIEVAEHLCGVEGCEELAKITLSHYILLRSKNPEVVAFAASLTLCDECLEKSFEEFEK